MKSLNHYLLLARRGDASAAFEAAKIMYQEEYNDVIVQAMLRRAGELGDVSAQRWLGFIGLTGKLIDPVSTTARVTYYKDASVAYRWFTRAASSGDVISAFAVHKCLMLGIGVEKDPRKAEAILGMVADKLSFDVIPLMFFFDTYHKAEGITAERKATLRSLIAG